MPVIRWKMNVIMRGADACMWGKHDINKVWLRRVRLHEIVRLRDIAKIDNQP